MEVTETILERRLESLSHKMTPTLHHHQSLMGPLLVVYLPVLLEAHAVKQRLTLIHLPRREAMLPRMHSRDVWKSREAQVTHPILKKTRMKK